jgi:hypothetical protein
MQLLFGASSNFYGGTCYGRPVNGGPAMVREFTVQSITTRSYVVDYGLKVNKKTMQLNCGNFVVDMFETAEAATQSLARK